MADKFRRKHEKPHVRIYVHHMRTSSWLSLSGNAVKVLLALCRYNSGTNNGDIHFSERQAAKDTGLARNTARRCISELVEKGWIAMTKPGAFNRNNLLAATYRITWQPWPGGRPAAATCDFERWREPVIAGNSQAQILEETASNFDIEMEKERNSGANSDLEINETAHVSVSDRMSKTGPQVFYHDGGNALSRNSGRKYDTENSHPATEALRAAALKHLEKVGLGGQKAMAAHLGCPPGTLSKFLRQGRGLPPPYRATLARLLKYDLQQISV